MNNYSFSPLAGQILNKNNNTVVELGETTMSYRKSTGTVSFTGSPQLPPVGMKLTEAIAAAKATLSIAFQRLEEVSQWDDSEALDEAAELRKALFQSPSEETMSEDEYIDYLFQTREDGLYDGISSHWGQD